MLAYGATITDVPSDNKKITKKLIRAMIAKAGQISQLPSHWWAYTLWRAWEPAVCYGGKPRRCACTHPPAAFLARTAQ